MGALRLFLLVCLGWLVAFSSVAGTAQLVPGEHSIALGGYLDILRDGSARLDIGEVAARVADFHPAGRGETTPGFDKGAYWLHFHLANPADQPLTRWLVVGHPRLQLVSLYLREGAAWQRTDAGTSVPLAGQAVGMPRPTFALTIPAGGSLEVFIRVISVTALSVEATLWEPEAYLHNEYRAQLGIAVVLGGTLLGACLAIFVYVTLGEPPYLYFALTQVFSALLELARNGLIQQYLWPVDQAFFHLIIPFSAGAASLFLLFFIRDFVGLDKWSAWWKKAFGILAGAIVVTSLGCIFDYALWIRLLSLIALGLLLVLLTLAFVAWYKGLHAARFLVFSLGLLWLSEGMRQLANQGIPAIPQSMGNNLSWVLVVMSPLLLFALTERTHELRRAVDQHRRSDTAKTRFLAHVSHELRAPLNTIIGFARMLRRTPPRLPVREGAEGIEANGLRLLGLIDELLDEARLQAGHLSLAPQNLAFAHWLDELTRAATLVVNAAGNRFVCERRDVPQGVVVDGARLRQVLDNLIGNANRHTRNGTIRLLCHAERIRPEDEAVRLNIAVTDDGAGIPPADQARIFDPFVQLDQPDGEGVRRAGFGMGLSISRELVRLMGGELSVTSMPGAGSTFAFSLTLPLAEVQTAESNSEVSGPAPLADGKRVLVVDDDPYVAVLLSNLLNEAGYAACAVSSGNEAVALLDGNGSWDAVLTDQEMHNGDGWFVLVCTRNKRPGLPVILFSAVPPLRPQHVPETMAFDAVLVKPSKPDEILAALAKLTAGTSVPEADFPTAPPRSSLDELLSLVDGGEVTGIEEWCDHLDAANPAWCPFTRTVRDELARLDFAALRRLAQPSTGDSRSSRDRQSAFADSA